jgi:hypothetical protein
MTRDSLDRYYTEPRLARAIVDRLVREDVLDPCECVDVLEPSSGRGAFVQAVFEHCPGALVTAVDLDPGARRYAMRADEQGRLAEPLPEGAPAGRVQFVRADFLDLSARLTRDGDFQEPYRGEYRLILGNPPFAVPVPGRTKPKPIALQHVLAALPLLEPVSPEAPRGGRLAFLLRQSFGASQERWDRLFRSHRPERIWSLVQSPRTATRINTTTPSSSSGQSRPPPPTSTGWTGTPKTGPSRPCAAASRSGAPSLDR